MENEGSGAIAGVGIRSDSPAERTGFERTEIEPMGIEREGVVERLREEASNIEQRVIDLRRKFHRHPELSKREVWTADAVCAELDAIGVPWKRVLETGVVATIEGTAPDAYTPSPSGERVPRRRLAMRADMDALPVTERTDAPYASECKGVMHACGHDCHMAMMLGAVRLLNGVRDQLRGEIRVIFQPAEEISCGARAMIEAGVLDGVDSIYGAHIWSEVDAGTFSCEPGQRMAHTDWFRIDIEGVSAHGSMPHKGVDAVVVGAEMVTALQVLVSRDVSPFEPVVVTVGEFHGGEARNIMAGTAYLTGTVRTWSDKLRAEVPERLERIVGKLARAFGAKAEFAFESGNAGLANDEECAARARRAVVEALGEEAVGSYEGTLSGEDFSEYLRVVPGVFVFVGARNPEVGASHPQHSCFYAVDESVLVKGSLVAAQYAVDYLGE